MIINDVLFEVDTIKVLLTLQSQLKLNKINLIADVKDTPNNVMINCPYHKNGQERKPSAGVRKYDGMFHCFACGETHTLPEVISYCFGKYDDLFSAFGWNWLLKNFATVSVENRNVIELDFSRVLANKSKTYVPEEELDKYRYTHSYMYKRKLNDEIIELFDIGYDKDTECITFPVRDITGGCLFVARRSVKTKFFNYPSGVEKPLYGLYELSLVKDYPKEIIVCESMLDALVCWVWGRYAVALNGLGDSIQYNQLNKLPCRKLILATDNDERGKNARKVLRQHIGTNKIVTEFDYNTYPIGAKDINDMTKEDFQKLKEVL